MHELVYYTATSIDGFIAGTDGDASHFPVLLGTGTPLLRASAVPHHLHDATIEALPGGVALATYRIRPTAA